VNAVVSSFDVQTLKRIAGLVPLWPRWLNTRDLEPATIAVAADLECTVISVEWHAIDREGLQRARDAGLEVAAWTVRRRATVARLARLGVVATCVEAAGLDGDGDVP
jgi:glycerophosphoryl diester phosphodiesterase